MWPTAGGKISEMLNFQIPNRKGYQSWPTNIEMTYFSTNNNPGLLLPVRKEILFPTIINNLPNC